MADNKIQKRFTLMGENIRQGGVKNRNNHRWCNNNVNDNGKIGDSGLNVKSNDNKKMSNIQLGLLNIRSITSSVDRIYELLHEGLDVLVLTETWHGSSDSISLRLAMPPGYSFVDFLRQHDPYHGGLIIFFRSVYKYIKLDLPPLETFEALAVKLVINKIDIFLLAIYRPGSKKVTALFFQELSSVLEHMTTLGRFVLLVGDLNIHIEIGNDLHTISLLETFDSFNMQNVVNEPTHECGGILDLIVSTHNFPVSSCKVYPSNIYSDHGFVSALLPIPRPPIKKIYKKVRAWNSIGNSNFVSLVKKSSIGGVCQFQNADEAFYFFNSELMSILDKVVPTHEVLSRYVPSAPWFDAECRTCKRYCRVRERKFRNDNCKKPEMSG